MATESKERALVLITGGSGLVGNSLSEEVKCEKAEVGTYKFVFLTSKDANLANQSETERIFDKYRPTHVINLAAKVGGLYANMRDNDNFYNLNMRINENVLRTAFEFKVKKCISCLSTCIFPDQVDLPLDESKIHRGPPHGSNEGYSLAKRQVDLINRSLNRKIAASSCFLAVIPTNLYGKHDNFDLNDAHVIPGLIHKTYLSIMDAKVNGRNRTVITAFGTGAPLRQFVYAPDLARFLIWCLQYYEDEEPIIVSPDISEEYSIRAVAEMICLIFSRKFAPIEVHVEFDPTYADGQLSKTASNRKLRKHLPDFEFTTLERGLEEVIDWFCEAYPNVRLGGR